MVKQMYYWSLFITAQFIFETSPVSMPATEAEVHPNMFLNISIF